MRAHLRLLMSLSLIAAAAGCGPAAKVDDYSRIPDDAYSITAEVRARAGKEDELRALSLPLIDSVRRDPKNLVYFLQEDRATPGRFVFYEIFANETDFEAHNNMPYVKAWLARLPELADGGVVVTRMRVLP